ncbi:MAG: hypothetical protein GTO63_04350 [Anaerolineae bacterium]|nr:hypothetical protein [Anaerolineae bacterium]NIN94242.1 hypothetical protein [Anaerolineae bacterium]NIQ77310.1 hypothetical protein [Anaerolineae bacterium]
MSTCRGLTPFCCLLVLLATACTTWVDKREAEAKASRLAVAEIQANRQRASSIIVAIEAYERDHRQLPDELGALVPTYLSHVPDTTAGENYGYWLEEFEGYYLCFGLVSKPDLHCCYSYRSKGWDCSMGGD